MNRCAWIALAMGAVLATGDAAPMTMERETVVFCRDLQAGSARLLFDPVEIMRVERANGSQLFAEGIDYTVAADGWLTLTPTSSIPVLSYYTNVADSTCYRFADTNGAIFYSPGGTYKHDDWDVLVTYSYTNGSPDELAVGAWASRLTTASEKLHARQPLNVTFFGDSITFGAQASNPSLAYAPLVVGVLKSRFGYEQVNYANKAVGGKTSEEIPGFQRQQPEPSERFSACGLRRACHECVRRGLHIVNEGNGPLHLQRMEHAEFGRSRLDSADQLQRASI